MKLTEAERKVLQVLCECYGDERAAKKMREAFEKGVSNGG